MYFEQGCQLLSESNLDKKPKGPLYSHRKKLSNSTNLVITFIVRGIEISKFLVIFMLLKSKFMVIQNFF
jgi:hypothetical protein